MGQEEASGIPGPLRFLFRAGAKKHPRNRRERCALRPGLCARRRNQARDMRAGARCAHPPAPTQARARNTRETVTRCAAGAGGGKNGTGWNETGWRNESAGWGRTRLQGGEFDVATISPRRLRGEAGRGARGRSARQGFAGTRDGLRTPALPRKRRRGGMPQQVFSPASARGDRWAGRYARRGRRT